MSRSNKIGIAALAATMLLAGADDAAAQNQQQAARQAAQKHNAQVLSARTAKNSKGQNVHHIKLLTKDGRVKKVKVTDRRKPKKPD